ncbi:Fe-S oxidoreductase [Archaeoglobus sulfaticallidus PM70-1]|uniref:Fe-S oxidoreductase n=1 Tax=Archaeoglobus sulfaticallidus PM70-1 TaxID=387631 RepID=N0BDB8_9EURY|nr:(Fe-S)-binding protein [Archaeoglobus sulfaticallidus]AGK61614.1 Fe-S oxidoreductase [Archaeoglobus sulfaticallidus PM70-1]
MMDSRIDSKIINEVLACAQCNYCRVCPAYQIDGWESVSPRGKLYLMKAFLKNKLEMNTNVLKDFFKCTTCGLCENVCQTDIPLLKLWEEMRTNIVELREPLPAHRKFGEKILAYGNPYGEDNSLREWLNEKLEGNSSTIFFAGCTASFKERSIAEGSVRLLNHFDIEFSHLGRDELCCGSTLFRTGQRKAGEKMFEKNLKIFEKMGVERIITSCAGCFRTFSIDYRKIAEEKRVDYDIEVYHITQILRDVMDNNVIGELDSIHEVVTYHDPCHLGRHSGVYDEPREIIKAIGFELVEMEHSRENSMCCGAGGGLRAQFKDLSINIARMRLKEAIDTGAKYLITSCPFCKRHLRSSNSFEIEVFDIVEILSQIMFQNPD